MTVIKEPCEGTSAAFQIIDLLIGDAHGTQGHAQVNGHILIDLNERCGNGGVILTVNTISPVDRYDDDGIGIGAILADVVHSALHVGTEGLDIGAGQRTLFLQDNVAPSLTTYEHLGTRVTILGHTITLFPVCQERLAEQSVLGPVGILAHSLSNTVEYGILVIIIDETVVQREYLNLFGQLGNEHDVGRLQRH